MWLKFLKIKHLIQLFGILIPALVYYQCTLSEGNIICRVFAQNAAYIMLFFFLFGFVAFALKKPYIMLVSWICTIMLCQFLKGSPENTFYYTKLQDRNNAIKVGHFTMTEIDSDLSILNRIKANNLDLVAVSFDVEMNSNIKEEIVRIFPFVIDLGISKAGEHNYLFSKHKAAYFKDLVDDNMRCSGGQIILDSIENKKISILYFSISNEIAENPKKLNRSLVSISKFKKASRSDEPLMVLGDVDAFAWERELRIFRTEMLLNDSRLDLDLEKSGRHIFFSGRMKCVSYKSFENGLIGTYEIRKPRNVQNEKDFISAR